MVLAANIKGPPGPRGPTGPQGPPGTTYVSDLIWSGDGPYSMKIFGTTHNVQHPTTTVYEVFADTASVVFCEVHVTISTSDVLIVSDQNINGKVVIK